MRRLALLVLVVPALAGCGSSSSSSEIESTGAETSESEAATTSGAPKAYGGLGSKLADFHRENPGPPPNPAGASPGLSWYTVLATSRGRVAAIEEEENDQPNGPNEDRLFDVSILPTDKEVVRKGSTCWIWRSHTLKDLIGDEYAIATTESGARTAQLHASEHPACD